MILLESRHARPSQSGIHPLLSPAELPKQAQAIAGVSVRESTPKRHRLGSPENLHHGTKSRHARRDTQTPPPPHQRLHAQVRVIQDRNKHGRIPIAGRLPFTRRGWVIAALGARGLIHHAYLGRLVAACALLDTDEFLPPQVMEPLRDLGKESTGDL